MGLSQIWQRIQRSLFPDLREVLGPLTEKQQQLVATLELVRIEAHIPATPYRSVGREPKDRRAIARAFVAKAVYNLSTTRQLIDRLQSDIPLRRLCGFERRDEIADESTFSRAFGEFAHSQLPQRVHAALLAQHQAERLVGHISRDSTAIEAREKPARKPSLPSPPTERRKPGRPKKGESPKPKPPTRLAQQQGQSFEQMLAGLPNVCDRGCKKNAKGYSECWNGYKLHIDAADGGIPIRCVLSSASVHDSQVALPLATLTARRVTSLYDLMDAAYDSEIIRAHSRSLGHVPIIDRNPRRGETLPMDPATAERYKTRTTSERVNARLKDDFGGRMLRVRGPVKVMAHLMFGILALTADQLLRLVL
jgi:hypothetical protein